MEPMDVSGKVGAGAVKGGTTEDCCSPAEALSNGKLTQVSPEDTEHFALLCKALGHPTRVQIVRLLMNVETCVCGDIVQKLPLAQSTVSQHLKILKDAGLVKGEIDGPRTCYALDHEALAEFRGLSDVLM
jgi:ArsR family transcriptional regulator